jgi:CheY-like chemotaxis protein
MPAGHPDRELVEDIRGAGERAETLTRQLLAMSRQTVMEPRVVDLNAVLAESDRMFRRIIGEDVSLCTALAPDLWRVRVDPARFDQVMLNLVVNARDAMPEGGRLTIETANVLLDPSRAAAIPESEPGEFVLVAVSDTGIGMTPEVQARVFEPFYTTKGAGHGTGLGMATAYGIVRQTGGHIAVYSEPGVGTVFKVYLPRVNGEGEAVPPPKVDRRLATGAETILLVEDEDGVRGLTARVLQRAGYRVFTAANGHEALALAEERGDAIDLLVTDVIMPQMNGRQLAERLLERWPGLRVLYVSGYTDDAVLRHGVLRAEVAFLQKPYLPSALTNKIRAVLDAPPGKRG